MEILIRLAGVQLGPYSEKQVRQHITEGLLSPTDSARHDGMQDWAPLSEVLERLPPPSDPAPEPAADETSETPEAPKRAPSAPEVTHLPSRQQEANKVSLPSVINALAKNTRPMGPDAPAAQTPSGRTAFSTMTTSPLASGPQGTKKVSRASMIKALAQKTSPLPTKSLVASAKAPPLAPPAAPAVPEKTDAPPALEAPPGQPPPKKAPLPSLIRALTAKTVPMRSAPPVPSSTGAPVTTTPMPTRPVLKPGSGIVPPPQSANSFADKAQPVVRPDPVQKSPQTAGAEVKTTKLVTPRTKPTQAPSVPPLDKDQDKPVEEPPARPAPRRILPSLIYACAGLALLALYYVWSPYHAAALLRNAFDDAIPAELDVAIDFPSVRDSLKEQIKTQLAQAGFPNAVDNASGGSTATTVLTMMDNSVDLYVTPEGISGLTVNPDQFSKQDLSQTISAQQATKVLMAFNSEPVTNQGLAALDDFVIANGAVILHLQFQGMGWKVKQVQLRPDLSAPASPGAASPLLTPVVNTFLERGDAKAKKGDWNGAIADYSQVLAIVPQSSVAYNARGLARESKGDMDGAIKDYTQALTIDPQMAAAYNNRGNAKIAKNDLDGAIADYSDAVRIDPTLAAAYDSRGNAKTAKDDLDGAIADYTQAITVDPKLASAYSDRGFARQANGNLDGAIADYTQALALKPKTAVAYYNRGLARQAQGNLEAAIVDFDRALAFDPKIAGAYYNRGNAKTANHDLDGAIADYTQAVTLNPKIALAYCNRGLARQAKGDLAGAVADYTQALAIDPKISTAYYSRALIEAQKDDLDAAIADSSQALDLDPKNAQAYYTRGLAKLSKGNLDGALSDLNQFCNLAPRDHAADNARLYLWLISKAQNSKADADEQLSDSLENSWNSSPDDLVSKTAAFLLGRMNEADYLVAADSSDAKTDAGQHCEAWYFAGMKRLLMGDKKGAIDAFQKCLDTAQKDYGEYILAQAELQALQPPVPPAPAPTPTAADGTVPVVPAKSQ